MKRGALALVAAALLLAGCGGGSRHNSAPRPAPTSTVTNPQQATLDTGASLSMAVGPAPTNWNPLSASATHDPALITQGLLPSAFTEGPDLGLTLNKALLLSAKETSTSPQTVVYRINPKATWSDGVPISWEDFQYNWEAQSGKKGFTDTGGHPFTPATTTGYRDISSVSETGGDPDRVTVVFSTPYPAWKTLFSSLVPAHVAAQVGFDRGFTDPVDDLVSGGPFLVESYQPGRSLTLVRNSRWWGTPASLSSVTFYFVTRQQVAVTAMSRQEVGAVYLPPSQQLVSSLSNIGSTKVDVAGSTTWEELEFNQDNHWLADPAVRKAIMLAIDRPQLITSAAGSYASAVSTLDSRVFVHQQPAYTDNSHGAYAHGDPSAAVSALSAAGYKLSNGILTKGGQPVVLRIGASPGALHSAEESFIAKELAAIGIQVVTDTATPSPSRPSSYDLAIVDRSASPALSSLDAEIGDPATVGTANYSQADYPAVDSLLARASATTKQATADKLYNQADADLWKAYESLPLFQVPTVFAYNQRYVGIVPDPAPPGPTWNLAGWGVPAHS